ncbi:MAG: molybdopterin molybdotransferase MoeA [Phycisphaerales bacterium]|nr:MAG: molybdopterin molybdotransferase MoeA [Phycisphaerales bacterium]
MCAEYDIGFEEALSKMLEQLARPAPVCLAIDKAEGLAAAEDCAGRTDCPSAATSSKDGYAVLSADLKNASQYQPVRLKVSGCSLAGGEGPTNVKSGTAVKMMTGARIPDGADAVIAEEFTARKDGWVVCFGDSSPGRNVIEQGRDVAKGDVLTLRAEVLTPAKTGLLAAGGISSIRVHPKPRIGILATGDELVRLGEPLKSGQLYASNLVTLVSWLRHFRMNAEVEVVGDQPESLAAAAGAMLERVDVLMTSGGAWKSERDLTIKVLKEMGGKIVFHRVRMGPGKAVALILLNGKTVFCLPGGPPSNEMAFLQIALPGLFHLAGRSPEPFEYRRATLTETLEGQKDWTQFHSAMIEESDQRLSVSPVRLRSRLQSQASANALIKIPEGIERLEQQSQVQVQVLFSDTSSGRSR